MYTALDPYLNVRAAQYEFPMIVLHARRLGAENILCFSRSYSNAYEDELSTLPDVQRVLVGASGWRD